MLRFIIVSTQVQINYKSQTEAEQNNVGVNALSLYLDSG